MERMEGLLLNELPNPLPKSLAHDCAQLRDLVKKVMLTIRARRLTLAQGTNGLIFECDRRGFDRLFAGMDAAIAPGPAGDNEVCKMVQLIPEVAFCCIYEETPEERVLRMMELVHPDKRADVLAEMMARVGGKQ